MPLRGIEMERDRKNECYHCAHKREVPYNAHIQCAKPSENVIGNQYGIEQGWFMYPFLFDPTWKENFCDNYQNHESVDAVISRSVSVAGESK